MLKGSSAVPQESALGLVLVNMVINGLNNETGYMLINSLDYINLSELQALWRLKQLST